MPRGRRTDIFATLRTQASKALQQLERQIEEARADLQKMIEQAENWRGLIGGAFAGARRGRPPGSGRGRRAGSGRVSWDDVLASVPQRFGVEDIMKHPGAASKGRAQVYPALTRWETAGRVRRVSKGVYEKVAGTAAGGRRGRRAGGGAKKGARRGRPAAAKGGRGRGRKKATAAEAAS